MRLDFEVSAATPNIDPKMSEPSSFSWSAALLGAAVGIAGPAYSGTLLGNVVLWIYLGQGRSVQEAYAYIGQYSLTLPMAFGFVTGVGFAITSGWVSAAYGRGASLLQGLAAGFFAASFSAIMLLNPSSDSIPYWYKAASLVFPILGSVVGAYAYARKA